MKTKQYGKLGFIIYILHHKVWQYNHAITKAMKAKSEIDQKQR